MLGTYNGISDADKYPGKQKPKKKKEKRIRIFAITKIDQLYQYLYTPCIEIFSLNFIRVSASFEWACFKIFAITEAYFGASDKDLTTE